MARKPKSKAKAKKKTTSPARASNADPAPADDDLFPQVDVSAMDTAGWNEGQAYQDPSKPVGTFTTRVKTAGLVRAQSSQKLQFVWELEIMEPEEHEGTVVTKRDGLGSPKQVDITQQQLARVGINAKRLSLEEVGEVLTQAEKESWVIKVQTRQNGEFFNVYFQQRVRSRAPESDEDYTP
ncbi:MAG: hypothetical protein GY835_22625 [bacterium]|nr:hypothetical protein [bacterium]